MFKSERKSVKKSGKADRAAQLEANAPTESRGGREVLSEPVVDVFETYDRTALLDRVRKGGR